MNKKEPTVLDYVKGLLMPWRYELPQIPPLQEEKEAPFSLDDASRDSEIMRDELQHEHGHRNIKQLSRKPFWISVRFTWQWFAALGFSLFGQLALEPPNPDYLQGVIGYGLAACFSIWALVKERPNGIIPDIKDQLGFGDRLTLPFMGNDEIRYKPNAALIGLIVSVITYIAFGGEKFTPFTVFLWVLSIGLFFWAFWQRDEYYRLPLLKRIKNMVIKPFWNIKVTRWGLLIILVLLISAFFRWDRLAEVPPQMISDHAEKLLDVYDVLHGKTTVFFPRNTGREGFQMYLTAAVILLFNSGYSFLSLKIGTTLLGFLTLPFIYLIGKELGGKRVGMWAMAFAGIAYWHNVISRIALRFTLTPFFTAAALYFYLRGMRRRSVNDFLISGFFLGLGLHGYSTMRIVPLIFVFALVLYLLHKQSKGWRQQAVIAFVLLSLISFVVFIPLLRYTVAHPEMVAFRTLTRVAEIEHPYEKPPLMIFLNNLWRAMIMFFVDNGEIWAHSVPHRPALDVVSAALFFLGIIVLLYRYIQKREWQDLFIFFSIPLLMMPSIMSLAFPAENPCLNRTSAAIIPVMVIIGLGCERLLKGITPYSLASPSQADERLKVISLYSKPKGYSHMAVIIGCLLFFWSALQNYNLVFNQYQSLYERSSWNSSEMGEIIKGFVDSIGDAENIWVVGYPHWVDTRLVAFNAGFPARDFAIWPEEIESTVQIPGNKIFVLKPEDKKGFETLQRYYPNGLWKKIPSRIPTKDFIIYAVFPSK